MSFGICSFSEEKRKELEAEQKKMMEESGLGKEKAGKIALLGTPERTMTRSHSQGFTCRAG